MSKQNVTKMITPPAVGAYVWLAKPDEGQQFSDGKFKVTLKLDKKNKAHKKFIKEMDKLSSEIATEQQANDKAWQKLDLDDMKRPYRDGDASGKEDFAGYWTLNAKTKFRPGMVDCSEPVVSLPEGDEPRSGDMIRIAVALNPYCMGKHNYGISAQLRNVQLIERNNTGQNDEFGSVDGGYTTKSKESDVDDEDDF